MKKKKQLALETKQPKGIVQHDPEKRAYLKEEQPFARCNRNFVNQRQGFGRAVLKYGVTGADFYVLAKVMDEMQRTLNKGDPPVLEFPSLHAFIIFLGLTPGGKNLRAAWRSLQRWEGVPFDFPRWDYGKKRKHDRYHERRFEGVLIVTRYKGRIKIRMDREFWKANYSLIRFVKLEPEIIRKLRTSPAILLYLLLLAFPSGIQWRGPRLFRNIGIRRWRTGWFPWRQRKRIGDLVATIERQTGHEIQFEMRTNSVFAIAFKRIETQTN